MKKILSIILTLTMLALPFAVQCSAKPAVSSNPNDVVIELGSDTEYNKPSGDGIGKKAWNVLKGAGKVLLVLTAGTLGTIGLCMSSKKGEAVYVLKDVSRMVWNDYIHPAATKCFSILSLLNDYILGIPLEKDSKSDKVTLTLGQWLSKDVQKPCEDFYNKKVFVKDKNGKEWHLADAFRVLRNCGWAIFLDQKDLEKVIASENKELSKWFGTIDEWKFWKEAWKTLKEKAAK